MLVLFFTIFLFFVPSKAQNLTSCDANDLASLQQFFEQIESGNSIVQNWYTNSNCCNWTGVTCDSGRVVRLELVRRRLVGNISNSLGNLEYLTHLNLSNNLLRGPVPDSLLHLPRLEVLDLSYNDLSGRLSSDDRINLPLIKIFNISQNSMTGSVPVEICINSTQISALNVKQNLLTGVIPPGIGNCTSLKYLSIGGNALSGGLPEQLFWLSNLTKLHLQGNRFSGQLSENIGNLSNLVQLDLSLNQFSGEIPDIFDRFVNLTHFSAQSNNLSGGIPRTLANSPNMVSLILRNNSLGGEIHLNCSAMTNLASLNLATNPFNGTIPENLVNCTQLRALSLARINFNGQQVPDSFRRFQSLSFLSLSNSSVSNLTSALGILQHCPNLTTLVLTLNFGDELMPDYTSLEFTALTALVIANCRLTGSIPHWLNRANHLQLLDLSWNRLSGSIPSYFGNFSAMFYLDLSNNSFTGNIPIELTQMQTLINGTVNVTEPSPDFPFYIRRNESAYRYRQVMSFPPTIELGNNFLTGQIWPEFGNLTELHVLDLKSNNLSGPIPSELSNMRSLETLDLSSNTLSGTIPSSLVMLSFMSRFSVAGNNLSGETPTGGQFATFPNASFERNPGLCGQHTLHSCHPSTSQTPEISSMDTSVHRRRIVIIGMSIGIGIGTLIIIVAAYLLILVYRKRQRKVVDEEKKDFEEHMSDNLVYLCQNDTDIFLADILEATNSFDQSNIIGCGGFGLVYKAILTDGRKMAIKRLSGEHFQMEREFQAEIETLSRAQHPNLVPLQGHCKYKNDRLLIYSFMENGSLDYWLHEKIDGPSCLNWGTRLEIARGAARGLAYLHQSCEPHILHRDIKSSNILLNEKFVAHVADFGLARLINPYQTHVTTDLVGTLGYIPPEYGQASVATYKGDIYSFGVVILELLTGKRPMDMCRPRGCRDLIAWVNQMRNEKRESEVFDSLIFDKQYVNEMIVVLEIACLCLSVNPKVRPSTQQLLTWLEDISSTPCFEAKDSIS